MSSPPNMNLTNERKAPIGYRRFEIIVANKIEANAMINKVKWLGHKSGEF